MAFDRVVSLRPAKRARLTVDPLEPDDFMDTDSSLDPGYPNSQRYEDAITEVAHLELEMLRNKIDKTIETKVAVDRASSFVNIVLGFMSVRAGGVIGRRGLHRIARIAQIYEVHALDDTAILYIEAGYDADFENYACPLSAGEQSQRCFSIEPPIIQRTTGNGTCEHPIVRLHQLFNVFHGGKSTRRDDRD